jgi:hypothetical protein
VDIPGVSMPIATSKLEYTCGIVLWHNCKFQSGLLFPAQGAPV